MKFKDLLTKLSELEATLHEFSYERLTATEARELKETLERFKAQLQCKIKQESDENVQQELKTVHTIDERNMKSDVDTGMEPSFEELQARSSLGSTRFNAYLKESKLSERQLAYINAILEAAEIDTRVTNDVSALSESPDYIDFNTTGLDKNLKTIAMSSADKRTSERKKTSKSQNKQAVKLDLNPILEDCLGEKDLLKELIALYKQNALEFIGQLKIHLQNADFEGIRFVSHKIKSGLRMMNTEDLLAIAVQIEIGSKTDQDLSHLKYLFDCFVEEYPKIEKAIDEAFEKLN